MNNIVKNIKEIKLSNKKFLDNYLRIFYDPPTYEYSLKLYEDYLKEKNSSNKIRLFKEDLGLMNELKIERNYYKKKEKLLNRTFTFMFIFTFIFLYYAIIDNFYYDNNFFYKSFIDLFIIKNKEKINYYKKLKSENKVIWLKYSKHFIF